jgi:thiamine biosynthesis lipoprotein
VARLRLRDRGVATSSSARRRWRRAGSSVHHLIDARSGLSADAGVLQVTVVAPTATAADVLAKYVFLAGERACMPLLGEHDAEALVIRSDGSLTASPGFGRYLA